jgi:nitrite reductase/ring-hydroxylating ferredoxin subunit
MTSPRLDRRALLGCAALYGVTGPLLVACSSDRATDEPETDRGTSGDAEEQGNEDVGQAGLVAAAEVPVGGGVALTDVKIVVTQPSEGEFKAFEAVCTHQGGAVTQVEDGEMVCSLHQSRFAIDDGAAVSGPASNPLPEVQVEVRDGRVLRT